MRKILMASAVAASLLAGQAMASASDVGLGDRDSAPASASDNMTGMEGSSWLFVLAGAALIVGIAYGVSSNNGDRPISP
jgi:hypothetical protein